MARSVTGEVIGYTSRDVELTLHEYEQRYGRSSAEFILQWRQGLLDHGDFEFSRWAMLIGIRDRVREVEAQQ